MDFIRRLVSGGKARFKDGTLNVDLDLVYITDQVIVMGYPAAGIEGLYRNRREDAHKFLQHRHSSNFWVFNLCPISENSYPASVFAGRVSRYPFPDHHAPPLAILPLVAREMREWIGGSKDRVAVLHCKAGKGRSGTIACAYLLALDDSPSPPKLRRSYNAKEWARIRADDLMQSVPDVGESLNQQNPSINTPENIHADSHPNLDKHAPETPSSNATPLPTTAPGPTPHKSFSDSLKNVLDLHTSRRMKPSSPPPPSPSKPTPSPKQGVSIPSQRRWLHYWSLILSGESPPDFWPATTTTTTTHPKVLLTQIKLRMKETSAVKLHIVKAASLVIERTSSLSKPSTSTSSRPTTPKLNTNTNLLPTPTPTPRPPKRGLIWVSLARYNDDLVHLLEQWERHTRDRTHFGKRRNGSDHDDEPFSSVFGDEGKWDKGKMVRSFARLGEEEASVLKEGPDKNGTQIVSYTLHPLSDVKWAHIRDQVQQDSAAAAEQQRLSTITSASTTPSAANSMYDVTPPVKSDNDGDGGGAGAGVVLDANREVRVKLYIGQVFMGWMWFIPTFHMPPPPSSSSSSSPQAPTTKFTLTRKEVDFPLGIGSDIIDVQISLEWCLDSNNDKNDSKSDIVQPPPLSLAKEGEGEGVVAGLAVAGVQMSMAGGHDGGGGGGVDVAHVVEAKQAAEN